MNNRNLIIDQTKGVLIILVVLGHYANWQHELFLMGLRSVYNPILRGGYNSVLSFHMPAFILISGYLSRQISNLRYKELDSILYPFLLFQILNVIFTKTTGWGCGYSYNILYPIYQNWYILALLFWRIAWPFLRKIDTKLLILLSLIVSIGSGFIFQSVRSGLFLALHRTLYFLPFFIVGASITDLDAFLEQMQKNITYAYILFIIGVIAIFVLSMTKYYCAIWYAYVPQGGFSEIDTKFMIRMLGLVSSSVLMLSFLIICYSIFKRYTNSYLVEFGKNSMPIYLFHGFIIFALVPVLIIKTDVVMNTILCVFFTLLTCYVFSRKKIVDRLTPMMKYSALKILFVKKQWNQ